MDLLALERLGLDLVPLAGGGNTVGGSRLTIAFFFGALLFLDERLFLFLLLLDLLADVQVVNDASVEGLLKEAGVVLESDGQVRAELGHLEEVHAGLSDDLLDIHGVRHFLLFSQLRASLGLCSLVALSRGLFSGWVLYVLEDIKREALVLLENRIDQVLVALRSIQEMNDVLGVCVYVGPVVVVLLDLLGRRD